MKQPFSFYFGSKDMEIASSSQDGLMSKDDKKKLDTISEGSNNYTHPANHPATMITEDETHRFVTDTEKTTWNGKANNTKATIDTDGLMSKEDKKKLDAVSSNANNYVHPDNHPATMITEDETHRFVTDEEKSTWNAKADKTKASSEADGLMAKEDKAKLDGVATGANKYVHPEFHEPTVIVQDETHRFVSDTEKATWNAKAETTKVTARADGLMSKEDKMKLDNLNSYTLASNVTVRKDEGIILDTPITTCKFVSIVNAENVKNGQTAVVYKERVLCENLVIEINDMDKNTLAFIKKVYKFQIESESKLIFLSGVKITTHKDSTVEVEEITEETFYVYGFNF